VGAPDLSPAQSVVLVSMLPAPLRVDLARPSTWLQRRSRRLLDRLHAAGRLDDETHRRAAAELDRILAGPRPEDDREEPPEEAAAEAVPPPPSPAEPPGDLLPSPPQIQNGGTGTAGQASDDPKEQAPASHE
jgi:monofunctional biosynthetic peptidoglycan transglycosylase